MYYIYNIIYSKLSTKNTKHQQHKPQSQLSTKRIVYQIPYQILELFIKITDDNTAQLFETAAYFCGKRNSGNNTMLLNHLVIPQQAQKKDQYIITGWNHIEYIEKHKLEIGCMIHTHPQHSLFLSVPDLIAHCALQMANNSSISIVYAPMCMNLSTKFDISPRRHPRFKQKIINKKLSTKNNNQSEILSNCFGFYCMTDKFMTNYGKKPNRKAFYKYLKRRPGKAYVNANNFEILFDDVTVYNKDLREKK